MFPPFLRSYKNIAGTLLSILQRQEAFDDSLYPKENSRIISACQEDNRHRKGGSGPGSFYGTRHHSVACNRNEHGFQRFPYNPPRGPAIVLRPCFCYNNFQRTFP